jgi:hypothetical protein
MDTKRLSRTILIYRVVQGLLIALLAFVAFNFQMNFVRMGRGDMFISSAIAAVVIQLILLYPVYKLASRDVGITLEGSKPDLSPEQLAALRKKRLMGELLKVSGFIFFITFAALVPDAKKFAAAPLIFAVIIFSFILTCLMYFQCFNYCLKRQMK